jgi:hypothetical protein
MTRLGVLLRAVVVAHELVQLGPMLDATLNETAPQRYGGRRIVDHVEVAAQGNPI